MSGGPTAHHAYINPQSNCECVASSYGTWRKEDQLSLLSFHHLLCGPHFVSHVCVFLGLAFGHPCDTYLEPSGLGLRPSTRFLSCAFLSLASGYQLCSYWEPSGLGLWPSKHLSYIRFPGVASDHHRVPYLEPSGLGLRPSTHFTFHATSLAWPLAINCVPYLKPSGPGLWPSTHLRLYTSLAGPLAMIVFHYRTPSGLGLRPSTHFPLMQLPWLRLCPVCLLMLPTSSHCTTDSI